MCGPIAMMIPVDRTNKAKKIIQIMTYHLGRLTAYATIGLVFGLVGKRFHGRITAENVNIYWDLMISF
jgi:sulfite exporter TauE/SafE